MVVLTEHFKEAEKRLGFPKEAVELFEKIAKRINAARTIVASRFT